MLARLLTSLNSGLHYLFGTGGWRLLPHEMKILSAVVDSLQYHPRSLCKRQLEQRFFVDRSNQRINFIPFGELPDALQITDDNFKDSLFNVRLIVDGKKETANVTFYKGFVFSVETKHVRKFYKDKSIQITTVERGDPKESMTHAIDRQEHGSMP